MSQQYTPNLGQLVGADGRRDAVHIAVAPVVAGHTLRPGDHVGFLDDRRVGQVENPIGIVDPFLTVDVQEGQQFWIMLYPGTITGLRHVWSHPAFAIKVPVAATQGERS